MGVGMMRKGPVLAFFLMAMWSLPASSGLCQGQESPYPFAPGEKLTFRVRWAFIPAGEAVLRVLPMETLNGRRAYHFVLEARTYPFVDPFYKVRDRIDAYTDEKMRHSVLYKEQKAGKRKRQVVVNFNWEKLEAQRSEFGEKRAPIAIKPGTFDPLSVYFAFRLHVLKENERLQSPVTDGKKCVLGRARVVRRERVSVESGTFDTFLVEPDLEHIGGVFKKSKGAKLQIWVTADKRRIPVKIKSKVAVGSFVGELISAENTLHP